MAFPAPSLSFTRGADRDLITADEAAALKTSGALIVDERRSRTRYFDGRFLAAKDSIRDQDYFLTRLADLGRAGGTGVLAGLGVTQAGPTTLTIAPGQGVTPAGETIVIENPVTVPLADVASAEQLDVAFGLSRLPRELAINRSGLFVLGLRPVEYTANPIASYPTTVNGPRSVQDGDVIEAAAVVLVPYSEPAGRVGSAETRRSRAARQVFVDEGALGVPEDVLPLAMIGLDRSVVQWVDTYLVRRDAGASQSDGLGFGFSPRALREAYVQQYLAQLADTLKGRAGSNLAQRFAAADVFQALPPVGVLPSASIDPSDFSQVWFPPQVTVDLSIVPQDELQVLIEESLLLPPIDLADAPDELASTAVIVLVPVPRADLPELQRTLTTPLLRLRPAAPGMIFQRRPIDALLSLTALRLPLPVLNPDSPIDAAWRNALAKNPLLWYARRRNLQVRDDLAGARVRVAGDELAAEQALGTALGAIGLTDRWNALKARASAPAIAEMTVRMEAPAFADRILGGSFVSELEREPTLDQAAVLHVASRYTDPQLGEGIARAEEIVPGLADAAVAAVIAAGGAAPELDRVGRALDAAALGAVGTEVIDIAHTGTADAPAKIAQLLRDKEPS